LRFGLNGREPQTIEEVQAHIGVTREKVRRIEAIALDKMKKHEGLLIGYFVA